MTEMQRQFEEWYSKEGLNVDPLRLKKYACWQAWQASREAAVVRLPVKFPENDDKDSAEVVYILDVLEQLAVAGVRYE